MKMAKDENQRLKELKADQNKVNKLYDHAEHPLTQLALQRLMYVLIVNSNYLNAQIRQRMT